MKIIASRRKLLGIGLALPLLAVAAAGLLKTRRKSAASSFGERLVFVDIEMLIANLQPENGKHVVQLKCTAQLRNEAEGELFKLYMPEVHHRLLLLMSEKKPSEIGDEKGRKRLLHEMLGELNKPYRSAGRSLVVKALFFTIFVVD